MAAASKSATLDEAMSAVQQAGIELKKDAAAQYGEYATLGNVLDQLRPVIEQVGLHIEQAPTVFPDGPGARSVLATRIAKGDESRTYYTPLTEESTMQKVGSSITYARRYALVSLFLLDADEDDDAGATAGSAQERKTVVKKKADDKPRVL